MNKISGKIKKILYRNTSTGLLIYAIQPYTTDNDVSEFNTLLCEGCVIEYRIGMPVDIYYEKTKMINNETHFLINKIEGNIEHTEDLIKFLTGNIIGFGKVKAEKLLNNHENVFQAALNKDFIDNIMNLLKIDKDMASLIRNKLTGGIKEYNLFQYLKQFGGTYDICLKLIEIFGKNAIDILRKNPYETLNRIGASFKLMDAIAFYEEKSPLSDERSKAILSEIMRISKNEGNSYYNISKDNIIKYLKYIKKNSPFDKVPSIIDILYEMQSDNYIIEKWHKQIVSKTTNKIYGKDELHLYTKKVYLDERNLLNNIIRIQESKQKLCSVTEQNIAEIEKEFNFNYSEDQKKAFSLLNTSGIKILTGGPGTGKTTTIKGLIKMYKKLHPDHVIKAAAPTGRASARLREICDFNEDNLSDEYSKTVESVQTIHKMLGIRPYAAYDEYFISNLNVEAQLLIIDETSMIDLWLMGVLLTACPSEITIIFVGDPNQLQSIGVGNILKDFIMSNMFETVCLTTNHRQDGEGKIIVDNANKILENNFEFNTNEEFTIEKISSDNFKDISIKYSGIENSLLLSATRVGNFGTNVCNRILQDYHIDDKSLPYMSIGDINYYLGDRIIFNHNNYDPETTYYNGDFGKIVGFKNGRIQINSYNKIIDLPSKYFADIELAYAITIHKSQGSEKDNIIIILSEEYISMLSPELLYTAITRAKKSVRLLIQGKALEKIQIHNYKDRNSVLSDKLQGKQFEIIA